LRRSTRIERSLPIFISGRDTIGQDFLERTSAVASICTAAANPSRHDLHVGTWITLQLGDMTIGEVSITVRAQVKSVTLAAESREMHHIGVELESPANIWSIPAPPSIGLSL